MGQSFAVAFGVVSIAALIGTNVQPRLVSHGLASFYREEQHIATGKRLNPNGLTAAHRTLPFGSKVRVTNIHNGRSVVVLINDRGPFARGRVIDLSHGAARILDMVGAGVVPVHLEVID